jgi:hypothetical protein
VFRPGSETCCLAEVCIEVSEFPVTVMVALNRLFATAILVGATLVGTPADAAGQSRVERSTGPVPVLSVVSQDPYTNPGTYHRTQVEPDTSSFESTVVAAFQTGRAFVSGASNLGWSVSSDGARWTDGFLPHTTIHATPPGHFKRVVDPSIAYDAKHDTWLVEGLGTKDLSGYRGRLFVSLSTDDARTFGDPVIVARAQGSQIFDKNWITCDNTPSSPFYGNCYTSWDDDGRNLLRLHAATSVDGGLTWAKSTTPRHSRAFGVQPIVQPSGTVVMPTGCFPCFGSFVSTDGGTTYRGPFGMPKVKFSKVHGGLRMPLGVRSADVDAAGTVYAVWHDCRFRDSGGRHCANNDVVMSTSIDGRQWSRTVRIPIDPRSSSVDHFLPAIAVDPATSGSSAHLAIVYYFYPDADCNKRNCQLSVGMTSSTNGGLTWTSQQLAGPFKTTWLPLTSSGYMVGDYISVSFLNGNAVPVFAVASAGKCEVGDITSCNEWIASATVPIRARP